MTGPCLSCKSPDRPVNLRSLCRSCYSQAQKRGNLDRYPSSAPRRSHAERVAAARPSAVVVTRELIEQALARTGSVLAAMRATGASYEKVNSVRRYLEAVNAERDVSSGRAA